MPFEIKSKVIRIEEISSQTFLLELETPPIFFYSKPGQFVMVGFPENVRGPFLRRPLAIAYTQKKVLGIVFRVVGGGTRMLSQIKEGQEIPILGPLGNNFPKPEGKAILVAGGVGLPPLLYAAQKWPDVELIYGEQTEKQICKGLLDLNCSVNCCTDDGSYGQEGFVTKLLGKKIVEDCTVYACGPDIMMKKCSEICAEKGVKCYVSLEAYMACGVGVCQGCAVPTTEGYQKVCKDGPVFDSQVIRWEELVD